MSKIAAFAALFPAKAGSRLHFLDALRGLAIVAMVIYHVAWDLYFLGLVQTDVIDTPGWMVFQRAIVTAFLLLVGAGLVLAHGEAIRWRPFWRRFALIAGAAVLTSIGTYLALPDYFVYFGILHAIALFSLLGLAFVRAPLPVTGLAAIVVLVPPGLVTSATMTAKPLSWIGFWPSPPPTTDIVPVFPWFGVVLLGIVGLRLLRRTPLWTRLGTLQLTGPLGRTLRWAGRWSLLIYLLHQPVIYGTLSLVADWMGVPQVL